ncbi:hypothetical protein HWV62_27599 [Athelia sp. TMB]|nr:hypothetical protein HWV62_27599 [Athelia sp. TMB]
MKLQGLTSLLALLAVVSAHDVNRVKHKRQVAPLASSSSTISAAPSASSAVLSSSASSVSGASSAALSAPMPGASSASSASGSISIAPLVIPTAPPGIPPLTQITMGMPTPSASPVTATYAAGSTAFSASEEVQEWMKELEGFTIPDLDPTPDGTCVNDTSAAADAANRGWWTCGGYTRPTDIVACPDKFTWGVRQLVNYLSLKNISATFFVVGSRVIERPQILVEQYMSGHEISVHTWSHRHLTSLTNAEIVAELGWTRRAIATVLGVTPTTMRPPYGDIDDRVRAISLAMGMTPIIWTRTPSAGQFDTNDWQVPGGLVTGLQSYQSFQAILGNASLINTGFIVLQHDLFPQTVDLATGYTLQAAMSHTPTLTLKPIGQCAKIPTSDLYRETNTNKTFPYTNVTSGDPQVQAASSVNSGSLNMGTATSLVAVGLAAIGFTLL